ncbi:MAG: hypothetical protein R3C59_22065 [Planctomycetaceae bacterium]
MLDLTTSSGSGAVRNDPSGSRYRLRRYRVLCEPNDEILHGEFS